MTSKTNEKITQYLLSVIFSVVYLFLSFALIAHAFTRTFTICSWPNGVSTFAAAQLALISPSGKAWQAPR